MKKSILIILLILIIINVSACTSTPKAVTDETIFEDARLGLSETEGYKEMVSNSIITTSTDETHVNVWVKVEFKDENANIKGTVILSYRKYGNAWVKKAYDFAFSSAQPYVSPSSETILKEINKQGFVEFSTLIYGYTFGDLEITEIEEYFDSNSIVIRLSQKAVLGNVTIEDKLIYKAFYIYWEGYWDYQFDSGSTRKTTVWDGTYKVELGTMIDNVLVPTKTFNITLTGTDFVEVWDDDNYYSEDFGLVKASFTLDGKKFENVGGVDLGDISKRFSTNFEVKLASGVLTTLTINAFPEFTSEVTSVIAYEVTLGDLVGRMTRVVE
jgi:hypothetical protein